MTEHLRLSKVVAYITRISAQGGTELLVFDHRDFPEAGTQVPAGTVEEGEAIEAALAREVEEETGLAGCSVVREIAVYDWVHPDTHNTHERHVFHMLAPVSTPDVWTWIETSGGVVPESEGYVFVYRWMPLDQLIDLAGNQGDYLDAIR
jgi:8-oxo-dGTP pyrophosphatase MutT (NUDIX family)